MVVITFDALDQQVRATANQLLRGEQQRVQALFSEEREAAKQLAYYMAGMPPVAGIIRAENNGGIDPLDGSTVIQWRQRLEHIFSNIMSHESAVVQIRYVRADGEELVRVDRYGATGDIRVVNPDQLQNKGGRQYFQYAMLMPRGSVYLSPVELNREFGEIMEPRQLVMRAALPIDHSDGERFGVIVANIDFAQIASRMEPLLRDSSRLLLANREGDYLHHPENEKTLLSGAALPGNLFAEFNLAPMRAGETRELLGSDQALIVTAIASAGDWSDDSVYVGVLTDYQVGSDILSRTFKQAVVLILLGMVAVTLLMIWLARWISRPLSMMERVVQERRSAELSESLPLSAPGEVGSLARAFDDLSRELRERNTRLQSVNKELSDYTYITSHDLQEPLRTVSGFVDIFKTEYKGKLDSEADEMLGFIDGATRRMQGLIKSLLDHGRIGRNPRLAPVNLNDVIAAIEQDLYSALQDGGGKIEVGAMPTINGLQVELRLLFQNLIGNALKFSRPGVPPVVRISAEAIIDGWKIQVCDNGIGIAREYRDRVFRIFQRLHQNGTYEGTGIGLAHSKKIVELHGGSIWITDSDTQGCCVNFTLKDLPRHETTEKNSTD